MLEFLSSLPLLTPTARVNSDSVAAVDHTISCALIGLSVFFHLVRSISWCNQMNNAFCEVKKQASLADLDIRCVV